MRDLISFSMTCKQFSIDDHAELNVMTCIFDKTKPANCPVQIVGASMYKEAGVHFLAIFHKLCSLLPGFYLSLSDAGGDFAENHLLFSFHVEVSFY